MPVIHKNWEVLPGESLSFNIDYREGDPLYPETLTPINLTNYSVRLVVRKRGQVFLEVTEPDIYKDAATGHIEVDIPSEDVLTLIDSQPVSYAVFLDYENNQNDTDAILKGRIKVVTNA